MPRPRADGLYANVRVTSLRHEEAAVHLREVHRCEPRPVSLVVPVDAILRTGRVSAQRTDFLYRALWNPIRLTRHGTVEIRAWTATIRR
jgi:hypothetical protein